MDVESLLNDAAEETVNFFEEDSLKVGGTNKNEKIEEKFKRSIKFDDAIEGESELGRSDKRPEKPSGFRGGRKIKNKSDVASILEESTLEITSGDYSKKTNQSIESILAGEENEQPSVLSVLSEAADEIVDIKGKNQSVASILVEAANEKPKTIDSILEEADYETSHPPNSVDALLLEAALETEGESQTIDSILQEAAVETEDESHLIDNILNEAAEEANQDSSELIDSMLQDAALEAMKTNDNDLLIGNMYKASAKAFIDMRESMNGRLAQSKIAQQLDKAYFQSMIVTKRTQVMPLDPLRKAIAKGSVIDVQMLLEGLGVNVTDEVMRPDSTGRTALHWAVLGSSVEVAKHIMSCYVLNLKRELDKKLERLKQEEITSISALEKRDSIQEAINKTKSKPSTVFIKSTTPKETADRQDHHPPQIEVVRTWFREERYRLKRQFEFRAEAWWLRIMSATDHEGRTLLHCIAGNSSSNSSATSGKMMEMVLTTARANIFDIHLDKKGKPVSREIFPHFSPEDLYDTATGELLASMGTGAGTIMGTSSTTTDVDVYLSAPSMTGRSASPFSSFSSHQAMETLLSSSMRSSQGGERQREPSGLSTTRKGLSSYLPHLSNRSAVVEYEVVIPWVLRNALRRASALGKKLGASGYEILEEMTSEYDIYPKSHSDDDSGDDHGVTDKISIMTTSEAKTLLHRLGIRLTQDIIDEICRTYICEDVNKVKLKMKHLRSERRQERRMHRARAKKLRKESSRADRKESHHHKDRKNFSRGKDSKTIYDDDDDGSYMYDSDSDSDQRNQQRSKSSKKGRHTSRNTPSSSEEEEVEAVDDVEENSLPPLMLDVSKLLNAIRTGHALRPLSTALRTSLLRPLNDERVDEDDDEYYKKLLGNKNNHDNSLYFDQTGNTYSTSLDASFGGGPSTWSAAKGKGPTGDFPGGGQSASQRSTYRGRRPSLPSSVTVAAILSCRRRAVDGGDGMERSPLLIAVALRQREVVEVLLRHGADISLASVDGHSPLSVAQDAGISLVLQAALVRKLRRHRPQRSSLSSGTADSQRAQEGREKLLQDSQSLRWTDASRPLLLATLTSQDVTAAARFGIGTECKDLDMNTLTTQLHQLHKRSWAYAKTPLSWAVSCGIIEAVAHLLAEGNDPNVGDSLGQRPLHECVSLVAEDVDLDLACRAPAIAEALLAAGADPNARSIGGRTPLHDLLTPPNERVNRREDGSAATSKSLRLSKEMSSFQGTGTKSDLGRRANSTLLKCQVLLLRVLLNWRAKPTLLDRNGCNAMHQCVRSDSSVACLVELLAKGMDPYATTSLGRSALHIACQSGAVRSANILRRWDADVRNPGRGLLVLRDSQGKTASQLLPQHISAECLDTIWDASRAGDEDRVKRLLYQMRSSGNILWEDIAQAKGTGGPDLDQDHREELWLQDGVDAKSRWQRWSPLHACVIGWANYICKHVHNESHQATPPSTRRLRGSGGGNPSSSSSSGIPDTNLIRRALDLPGPRRKTPAVDFDKRSRAVLPGPPVNATDVARRMDGYAATMRLLLQNNAYVDGLDYRCRTPLMLAAATGLSEALRLLLSGGAGADTEDLAGNTALHYSYAFGFVSSSTLLESRGASTRTKNQRGMLPVEVSGMCSHSDFKPLFRSLDFKLNIPEV